MQVIQKCLVSHAKFVFFPSHWEYRHQFAVIVMFETIPCEIRNTQTPFKNLLLAVDRLIPSEKTILGGTGHERYLSPSLKSTALPEFTDQDMIWGMMFRFTCNMDASLPIFIFMVLPVLMDSFRLFLFIGLLNDVTPLSKWFCIKQPLSWILVCL